MEDGNAFHFERSMDVDPIFDGVRAMQDIADNGGFNGKLAGARYIGSVDPITAANWSKECGYAIGTKGFAAFAKKKLLSGEFSKYAVSYDRRLINGAKLPSV